MPGEALANLSQALEQSNHYRVALLARVILLALFLVTVVGLHGVWWGFKKKAGHKKFRLEPWLAEIFHNFPLAGFLVSTWLLWLSSLVNLGLVVIMGSDWFWRDELNSSWLTGQNYFSLAQGIFDLSAIILRVLMGGTLVWLLIETGKKFLKEKKTR